jgi:hypothetical protein
MLSPSNPKGDAGILIPTLDPPIVSPPYSKNRNKNRYAKDTQSEIQCHAYCEELKLERAPYF